jgi:hypothetical protein
VGGVKPKFRVVGKPPQPAPPTDYEWQERQRIARKDWAAIHVRGDRSAPVDLPGLYRVLRPWR